VGKGGWSRRREQLYYPPDPEAQQLLGGRAPMLCSSSAAPSVLARSLDVVAMLPEVPHGYADAPEHLLLEPAAPGAPRGKAASDDLQTTDKRQ